MECQRARDELDLALLSPALASSAITPLSLDFTAAGKGGNATLRGKVKQGEQELELAPSVVSLQDQVLKVSPLLLKGLGGEARLEGTADFSQEDQQKLNFSVVARDLTYVPAPDPNTAGSARCRSL